MKGAQKAENTRTGVDRPGSAGSTPEWGNGPDFSQTVTFRHIS